VPYQRKPNTKRKMKAAMKCGEEFLPVHNFFLLRFSIEPQEAETFFAKCATDVDLKIVLPKARNDASSSVAASLRG